MKDDFRDPETAVSTLANGVRVIAMRLPHVETVGVSVFMRSGSQHENARLNGISHVVEHMAFKGTLERDCQQINLDAERLGADVNAHTDKDHTAFQMSGLGRDAGRFVAMLGDIVRHCTFPEAELERERQVILHEYLEDEDDALSTAYKLFDRTCFGTHPVGQPVIGTRRNIQRFTRADLLEYVQRQYTGANTIVGIAGAIDPEAMQRAAETTFADVVAGEPNMVAPPDYLGGIASRRQSGCNQTHVVLGFPIPSLRDDDPTGSVAAALFGEGMSSPLMDQIRERRGLAYYAACTAEERELSGQFVVEASTVPEHVDELFIEVMRLLRAQAEQVDPVGLQRASNQIAVRVLRDRERPLRRLEDAAQDLFVHGRIRPRAEAMARIEAIDAETVRSAFERLLKQRPAIAIAGKVGKGVNERVLEIVEGRPAAPPKGRRLSGPRKRTRH